MSNTHIRLGKSGHATTATAARDAVEEALRGADEPLFALVFATPQYPPDELAAALGECLGELPWAGCSALGVFAGVELFSRGVVVAVLDSSSACAQVGLASDVAADPRRAGGLAVSRALSLMPAEHGEGQRMVILLPDTSEASASAVLRGAISEGGSGVVWAGGGAGDVLGRQRLVQFAGGRAHTDSVVAIAIDFVAPVRTGVRHGWRPVGPPALVTRASGNTAHELEYRSAFQVYRETASLIGADLDEDAFAEYAMLHPLGIPQANEHFLVRDPVAIDEGGLRCVAEVPDGALVRMMRADRADIVAAAGGAAEQARDALGAPLAGALVFDCISRHLILGASFVDELAAFCSALGEATPVFGCLTFGEVASFEWEVPQFHNKTTVVVAIPAGSATS